MTEEEKDTQTTPPEEAQTEPKIEESVPEPETVEEEESKQKIEPDEKVRCTSCNSAMILRKGRYGSFYGCSRYPRCGGTRKVNLIS